MSKIFTFVLQVNFQFLQMNIALIGYGRMGQAVEKMALQRGHQVVLRITSANKEEMNKENLQKADVAIEFTGPESGKSNVLQCLGAGIAVVSGTTGWNESVEDAAEVAHNNNTAFLYASNFSIGVNLFLEINKHLAALMNNHPEYDVTIEETHHTHKKDAPSGTAITLAEQILQNMSRKNQWRLNDMSNEKAIPILANRVGNVPGTHKINYSSAIDDIQISHIAHNRDGFAQGAVLAAEYITGRQGVFYMRDVLGIK